MRSTFPLNCSSHCVYVDQKKMTERRGQKSCHHTCPDVLSDDMSDFTLVDSESHGKVHNVWSLFSQTSGAWSLIIQRQRFGSTAVRKRKWKKAFPEVQRGDGEEGRVEIGWKHRWLNWRKGKEEMEGKRLTLLLTESMWLSPSLDRTTVDNKKFRMFFVSRLSPSS